MHNCVHYRAPCCIKRVQSHLHAAEPRRYVLSGPQLPVPGTDSRPSLSKQQQTSGQLTTAPAAPFWRQRLPYHLARPSKRCHSCLRSLRACMVPTTAGGFCQTATPQTFQNQRAGSAGTLCWVNMDRWRAKEWGRSWWRDTSESGMGDFCVAHCGKDSRAVHLAVSVHCSKCIAADYCFWMCNSRASQQEVICCSMRHVLVTATMRHAAVHCTCRMASNTSAAVHGSSISLPVHCAYMMAL